MKQVCNLFWVFFAEKDETQKEDDFYDWLGTHLTIHQQIVASLGL